MTPWKENSPSRESILSRKKRLRCPSAAASSRSLPRYPRKQASGAGNTAPPGQADRHQEAGPGFRLWRCFRNYLWPLITLATLLAASSVPAVTTEELVEAALERTTHRVTYDGSYHSISYPGGDVPAHIGVCTDVVIRSYRSVGIDLQVLVHEDMRSNFQLYPSRRIWGLQRPDRNIDHRRVPNLQVFFTRHGETLAISTESADYHPGDLVTWMLPGNLPHIGLVSDRFSSESGNPLIVHNIGRGPKLEDALFTYPITGHYRYLP